VNAANNYIVQRAAYHLSQRINSTQYRKTNIGTMYLLRCLNPLGVVEAEQFVLLCRARARPYLLSLAKCTLIPRERPEANDLLSLDTNAAQTRPVIQVCEVVLKELVERATAMYTDTISVCRVAVKLVFKELRVFAKLAIPAGAGAQTSGVGFTEVEIYPAKYC
jgi:hypothetical protein